MKSDEVVNIEIFTRFADGASKTYFDEVAASFMEANPNIKSEDEVLGQGFDRIRAESGLRSARYYIWYHEDYPSDLVSEYFWLQRQARIGVDQ
mgnify:CR=1 FL=1